MALVSRLEEGQLTHAARHLAVTCTYCVVELPEGKHLQLDSYGSQIRQIKGKKSQSLRLSPEAIAQLKRIIESNNL